MTGGTSVKSESGTRRKVQRFIFVYAAFAAGSLAGCFPHQAGPRLAHFPALAPAVGESLPPLRVADLAGHQLELGELLGEQPVVLQLGSVSCPVFRYRRHGIERLARRFAGRVRFLVLYTREAHPVGSASPYTGEEWDPWINRITGVRVADTTATEDRRRRAQVVRDRIGLVSLVVVDPEGDPGWRALGRAPSAAFVIDREGRVVARQAWVDPAALRRVLDGMLAAEP
jgi:hypothetical protein